MDRTEVIFETPSIVEFQIRVKKVNKTRSLVGSITFHEPFGNNIKVEGKALKKQGKFVIGTHFDTILTEQHKVCKCSYIESTQITLGNRFL